MSRAREIADLGELNDITAVKALYTSYDTVALLLASTETTRGTGALWEAGGFRYTEVASGGDETTAGGIELDVYSGPRYWANNTAEYGSSSARGVSTFLAGQSLFPVADFQDAALDGVIAIGSGIGLNSNGFGGGIAIGDNIMSRADPGPKNDIIGNSAGVYLDKDGSGNGADRNTIMGSLGGHFMTTGERNVTVGRNSMHGTQTGIENANVGYAGLMVGVNPVVDDAIIHQGPFMNGDYNANVGRSGLRYYAGDNSVNVGALGAQYLKQSNSNAFVGADSLRSMDLTASHDGFEMNEIPVAGDAAQVGSTVTVTLDTPVTLTAGKWFELSCDTVTRGTGGIWYQVLSVTSTTIFTFTNAIHGTTYTGDVASTPCTLNWHETATVVTQSTRNTGLGYRFGFEIEQGSDNLFLGPAAGNNMGTTYNAMMVMDNGFYGPSTEAMMVGNFSNNRMAVGGTVALVGSQTSKLAAYEAGAILFSIHPDGTSYHGLGPSGVQTQIATHTFYGVNATGTSAALGIADNDGNHMTIGLSAAGNVTFKTSTVGGSIKFQDVNGTTIVPS